jgi:hypothetical protein
VNGDTFILIVDAGVVVAVSDVTWQSAVGGRQKCTVPSIGNATWTILIAYPCITVLFSVREKRKIGGMNGVRMNRCCDAIER